MENINAILLVVQVILSVALIALILIQHGKGADAGAAFGSGASATVFGARGSGNFLTKATSVLAMLFFATCLALAYIATNREGPSSIVDSVVDTQQPVEQTTILEQPETDLPPVDGDSNMTSSDSDLPPAE